MRAIAQNSMIRELPRLNQLQTDALRADDGCL